MAASGIDSVTTDLMSEEDIPVATVVSNAFISVMFSVTIDLADIGTSALTDKQTYKRLGNTFNILLCITRESSKKQIRKNLTKDLFKIAKQSLSNIVVDAVMSGIEWVVKKKAASYYDFLFGGN